MKIGVLESNGYQNYKNWEEMKKKHPMAGSSWIEPKNGIFSLDKSFYNCGGGLFDITKLQVAKIDLIDDIRLVGSGYKEDAKI
jgi:hypothetical protein